MREGCIRFRSAAVFLIENRILVHEVPNADDGRRWFIPPGGGVNYGETSQAALVREIREELGWEIGDMKLLGAFESFHLINGRSEHEVSFVYRIPTESLPLIPSDAITATEENGTRKNFRWVSLDIVRDSGALLYPPGLLEKLGPQTCVSMPSSNT